MMSMPMEMITDEPELRQAGFYWRESECVKALVCSPIEEYGFANGFSTRLGGCSPMPRADLNLAGFNDDSAENINENRRRYLKLFGDRWTLTGGWQMHGSNIRTVRDAHDALNDSEHCDALITNTPRVLLGVKTADCVPVLLADMSKRAVAAVHAGWRGSLAGITALTVERMRREYGAKPKDLLAAIGPAASSCCYEVGPEVIRSFNDKFGYATKLILPTSEGKARIDLKEANRRQLISSGVDHSNIYISPFCTICSNDLFFSYRLEKQINGRVGRLLSVVGVRERDSIKFS